MADHTPRERATVQRALLRWHSAHAMQAPWRTSGDPYQALVAATMAQQTQMSRVIPSYERFIEAFPTLESLANASAGQVIRVWAGMGYNTRAVRLHRAAQAIAASGWPRDAAALQEIPGIGPFTAAIIASFAFGLEAACVDTNVRRVLGRITGDERIDGPRLQRLADAWLSRGEHARWNQALMDYGARVCVPRPKCGECVVAKWCASRERFAAPLPRNASVLRDAAASYAAGRRRPEPAFEGSPRWWRGRIIDALRATSPGEGIALPDLPLRIANGHAPLVAAELRTLVAGLEKDGLAVVRRIGRREVVSLPE